MNNIEENRSLIPKHDDSEPQIDLRGENQNSSAPGAQSRDSVLYGVQAGSINDGDIEYRGEDATIGLDDALDEQEKGEEKDAVEKSPSFCPRPQLFLWYWLKWSLMYILQQLRSLTRRWIIGIVLLIIVNFLWAASSMVVQSLLSDFDKPFFLTYFSTSLFSLFLMGFVFFKSWRETDLVAQLQMEQNAALRSAESDRLLANNELYPHDNVDTDPSTHLIDEEGRPRRRKFLSSSTSSNRTLPDLYTEIRGSSTISALTDDSSASANESNIKMTSFVAASDDDDQAIPTAKLNSAFGKSDFLNSEDDEISPYRAHRDHGDDEKYTPPSGGTPGDSLLNMDSNIDEKDNHSGITPDDGGDGGDEEKEIVPIFPVRRVALLALQFLPIWFIANITFNWSLKGTSVTSNSIISTTSSFWTLLFCHLFKVERFTILRTIALVVTLGGVTMVALSDKNQGKDSLIGDALAIVSAICYGVYASFLRIRIKDETQVKMGMFFGFVGFFNLILLWPFFFILHYTKVEVFEIPTTKDLLILTANGLVGTVLSDLLWSLVIFLSSATVATIGLSLNVPFSLLLDLVIKRRKFPLQYYAGAGVVLIGFFVANLSH